MAKYWFKFYGGDYLSDPKMLAFSAVERSCWLTLLCYASMADGNEGEIKHLTEERLMSVSGINHLDDEWEKTKGVLKKFSDNAMITLKNNTIVIKNWRKRQEMALTGYERVKRFREKHVNDNCDNVDDNIRVEKSRVEKSREERKEKRNPGGASGSAGVRPSKFSPLGAEIIKAFEAVDPKNKTYYANKTQRSACDFLVSEFGLEKVLEVIAVLPRTNPMPYFPKINSPYDLKEKWQKLMDAVKSKRTEAKEKLNFVL